MFGRKDDAGRAAFEAQFEPVAGGVHYRPGGVGEPYRLTEAEQAEAVETFARDVRRLTWGLMIAMFGLLGGLAWFSLDFDISLEVATLAIMGVTTGVYVLAYRRAMHAPARRHQGRQVPGDNRSKAEVRAAELRKMSWMQVAGGAVAVLVVMLMSLSDTERGSAGFWAWLLFFGGILALLLARAIAKWRLPPEG